MKTNNVILNVSEDFGKDRPEKFNLLEFLKYCRPSFGKKSEAIALYTGVTALEYNQFMEMLYKYKKYMSIYSLIFVIISIVIMGILTQPYQWFVITIIIIDILLITTYIVCLKFIDNVTDGLLFHAINKSYLDCVNY